MRYPDIRFSLEHKRPETAASWLRRGRSKRVWITSLSPQRICTNVGTLEVQSGRASKRSTPLPETPQSIGSDDDFSDYEDEASGAEAGRLNSEPSRSALILCECDYGVKQFC